MSRAVEPERLRVSRVDRVERELAELWRRLRTGRDPGAPPIRACMSNLIVFCQGAAALARAEAEAAAVVERHPSRVLLLAIDEEPGPEEIEAVVSAYCHIGGSGSSLCSEAVTLRAAPTASHRLPSAARALLIGDLPTALWWTPTDQAPPRFRGLLDPLADMSDQVIYDSRGWLDPVGGVIETAEWAEQGSVEAELCDLAWRRLKPWRRLLAQTLDPRITPGALETLAAVEVEHGPHALPKAWLLIGWLACRLGWRPRGGQVEPGIEVTWGFESPRGPVEVTVRRRPEGEPEVVRVGVRWSGGGAPGAASFASIGGDRIALVHDGSGEPLRVLAAPLRERPLLVARQLPNLGHDELFRRTLEISRSMARALTP